METKQGKVIAVNGNGTWDSPNGTLYRFEIEMDNGDRGQYLSKSANCTKFVTGEDAHYTTECQVRGGREYWRIKPAQDPNQSAYQGGGYKKDPQTDTRITRMSVLKVAGDLCIADKIDMYSITSIAQLLEKYVTTGEDTLSDLRPQDKGLPF